MAFDPNKFREAAKKANFTDEEISAEISRQTQNINTATGKPFGQAGEEAVQGKAQELRNQGFPMPGTEAPKDERSLASQLFDWASTPAGNAVIGGLVGLAAAGVGGAVLKGRMRNQSSAGPKIDPTFDGGPPPPPPPPPPPQGDVTDVASRPVSVTAIDGPKVAPTGIPTPQPFQGAGLQQPSMTYGETTLNAPTGAPSPLGAAPPAESKFKQKLEKPLSAIDDQLSAYKAKTEMQPANEAAAKASEKLKAVPSVPTAPATPDVNMSATPTAPVIPPSTSNSAQSTSDSLTKEQKGMKNYLVSQYGGGPEGEAAYKKTIDILGGVPAYEKGQGGGLSKEANETIKNWRKANIEGPKVNLTYDMKKVMKGAGGAGILMALPGFAEAAQKKDMGKMSDIFTDFFVLPFAQSRGLNDNEEQELAKRRYEGAVGGGRGIAPPSSYQK